MIAKDKAEELVKKMYAVHSNSASDITLMFAKCALIAVDEVINSAPFFCYDDEDNFYRSVIDAKQYWEQVKQEIEKL
jgi:hypothetical protein